MISSQPQPQPQAPAPLMPGSAPVVPAAPQTAQVVMAQPAMTPAAAPQPVFYSLSPEEAPKPTPWFKKRQLVVMAVSLLVAMLVLGAVIVFAARWIAQKNAPAKQAAEQATSMLSDKLAACDQSADPESCKSGAGMQVANATGVADVCKTLTGEAYDSCVSLAAETSANVATCGALTGDAKTACEDGAYSAQALAKNDVTLCAKIVDEAIATGCVAHVTEAAVSAGTCAAAHVDETLCSDAEKLRTAIATGLESSCAALSSEDLQIDCTNGIHSLDQDGDGLTVFDEVNTYHTDPLKPDTDGDGYTDGEEVASGHDPLKK